MTEKQIYALITKPSRIEEIGKLRNAGIEECRNRGMQESGNAGIGEFSKLLEFVIPQFAILVFAVLAFEFCDVHREID
jgi:hypothetical protein